MPAKRSLSPTSNLKSLAIYVAETGFWQVVKNVLRERQRSEFDHAIRTVSESLEMTKSAFRPIGIFCASTLAALAVFGLLLGAAWRLAPGSGQIYKLVSSVSISAVATTAGG